MLYMCMYVGAPGVSGEIQDAVCHSVRQDWGTCGGALPQNG